MSTTATAPSIRDLQTAATRERILEVAMEQLGQGPRGTFSHESIAEAAGIGVRTVYRHFPDRAVLLHALWERLREATKTRFPDRADEIIPLARAVFQEFDANETLVRAVLTSPAGTEVRERGGVEGRAAFTKSLAPLIDHLPERQQAQIVATFVAIYSAPFWNLLRERGRLSGPEAQETVVTVLDTLLRSLSPKS